MADAIPTDVTNSEAIQTDASETTASSTSTTPTTEAPPPNDGANPAPADPLDGNPGIAADPNAGSDEEGEAADENAVLFGAPEGDYELNDLPEGFAVDKAALDAFAPLAKRLNLSNEGVKALATEAYPLVEQQTTAAITQQVVAQRKEWETATRTAITGGKAEDGSPIAADPAFGGASYDQVVATSAKALDRFAGDAVFPGAKADGSEGTFRDFLTATGLGNHPAMVRFAYMAGQAISEDSDFVRTGAVPPATLSRAEKYYGPGAG